ncbi:MAG: T9SS type A sorting domain-containing protein [Saprospiraceae bacterium]|nr:T9SS type A sorting domain-containing protein [Saprospiraceae bacterium]MDW8229895.1 T9SS type A sorting domain-containing protein [Saprospiraceae bacterium]
MTKKTLFTGFFALLAHAAVAQTWFQNGDQWVYYVTTGWDGSNWGLHRLSVGGDTLLGNTVWKKLVYTQITQPPQTFLVRAEGQQVFHLNFPFNSPPKALKIYDFSLRPGDTMRIDSVRWYLIVDTTRIMAGNQQRRVQHFRWRGTGPVLAAIEGIGMTGLAQDSKEENACSFFLLAQPFCMGAVDGYSFFFRCFSRLPDDRYWPFSICSTLSAPSPTDAPVRVWPNPAYDLLWVSGQYRTLQLFDAQGRLMWESAAPAGAPAEILVAHLPRGVYFLWAFSENGVADVQRVVLAP